MEQLTTAELEYLMYEFMEQTDNKDCYPYLLEFINYIYQKN